MERIRKIGNAISGFVTRHYIKGLVVLTMVSLFYAQHQNSRATAIDSEYTNYVVSRGVESSKRDKDITKMHDQFTKLVSELQRQNKSYGVDTLGGGTGLTVSVKENGGTTLYYFSEYNGMTIAYLH